MDKLFAIQRPDGTVVQAEPSHGESRAWFNAYVAECPSQMNNMAHAKSLGYRCVEVEVVKAGRVCEWRYHEFGSRVAGCSGLAYIGTQKDKWKFCPHCGGKIKEAGK